MCPSTMVFDILSFLVGIAAGGVTGGLAGMLHGLESTADLQEKIRQVASEVDKIRSTIGSSTSHTGDRDSRSELDELYRDLNEIQEEIRRLYKKGKR
jgi:gas vesicle protein